VPKLGLGRAGISLSLPTRAQLLPSPSSDGAAQQGPSPSPPQAPGSAAAEDSDDSSDEEEERGVLGGGGGSGTGAASARQQSLPGLGMEVPAGFVWSGDLEEDLDRLEALEVCGQHALNGLTLSLIVLHGQPKSKAAAVFLVVSLRPAGHR